MVKEEGNIDNNVHEAYKRLKDKAKELKVYMNNEEKFIEYVKD